MCRICDGQGCDKCDWYGYRWDFERDPEVACRECGESFREGGVEAEFIGWNGKCPYCND